SAILIAATSYCVNSFIPQRYHWIYLGSSSRRDVARQQRNRGEQHSNARKRQRISRANAEEQARQHSRQRESRCQADPQTDQGQLHTLPDDQLQNRRRLRSKRDANADLVCALSHRIRDNSVDPQRCKDQRKQREDSQQRSHETPRRYRVIDQLLERLKLAGRQIGIDASQRRPHAGNERVERQLRSYHEVKRTPIAVLSDWKVHLQPALLFQRAVTHVADYSDDLPLVAAVQSYLPDRVPIGPEPLSHRLVYHEHLLAVGGVVFGKLAAGAQWNFHCPYIPRADHARISDGVSFARVRFAFCSDSPGPISSERKTVGQADGLDARDRLNIPDEPIIKRVELRGGFITAASLDSPGRGLLWAKAGINLQQPQEAPNK